MQVEHGLGGDVADSIGRRARPCRAMIISDRISEARPETASRVAREAAKNWGYAWIAQQP